MILANRTSLRGQRFVTVVFILLGASVVFGGVWLRNGYLDYVERQGIALANANVLASQEIAGFVRSTNQVTIVATNTTGGTMHVYVGDIGAMQNVGDGVTVPATPLEIATVAPHAQQSMNISAWENKYIQFATTYIFLGTVRGTPEPLKSFAFDEDPSSLNGNLEIFAIPDASDTNYTPPARTMSQAGIAKSGSDLDIDQAQRIETFVKAHSNLQNEFPTTFWSYLVALRTAAYS